jgi:AbrB family looped-hinge helix DNA binding protein
MYVLFYWFVLPIVIMNIVENDCPIKMRGSVTVWTKGQVVIPKEVRSLIKIESWDTLMVITKDDRVVWLIKSEDVKTFLEYMQQVLHEKDI